MKKLALTVALILTISAAVYGGFNLWGSDLLELERVEVTGNQRVAKEELVKASGLRRGVHLLSLSTQRARDSVEAIPWIESARVERIIPSTVRITVSERQPAALVSAGARRFLVDRDGVILDEGSDGFVVITDLPIAAVAPGSKVDVPSFFESLVVMRDFEETLRPNVEFISAASIDRITIRLSGGLSILYGAHEEVKDKNFAITAVIAEAEREGNRVASIDVRVPNRPAVRLR